MTLGQRIQELRRQKQLSQEALGEQLGVSRQAISKWESDLTIPELDKLIAMSKLFAVSLNELLGVEEPPRPQPEPRPRHPRLLPALCALLAVVLAVSLGFNLHYYKRVLNILDPPAAPLHPITALEYAVRPDEGAMTYDLALSLQDDSALSDYDVTLSVSTLLGRHKEEALVQQGLSFSQDGCQLLLEDLPFGFYRNIYISLHYTRGDLTGEDYLMALEPQGSGSPWEVRKIIGDSPTIPQENPELL